VTRKNYNFSNQLMQQQEMTGATALTQNHCNYGNNKTTAVTTANHWDKKQPQLQQPTTAAARHDHDKEQLQPQ